MAPVNGALFTRRKTMSRADKIFIQNCKDILENGYSSENQKVRPVWEDGTPAYTLKRFGIVNRYDLSKEFPILTLRHTNWKAAIDEILWIWQKKSNHIQDLNLSLIHIFMTDNTMMERINVVIIMNKYKWLSWGT